MKIQAVVERYFAEDFIGRAEGTVRRNQATMQRFSEFLGTKDVDEKSYSAWVKHVADGYAKRTGGEMLSETGRFLAWCEKHKLIPMPSPHRLVRRPLAPKEDEPREPFTPEEYASLLKVADFKDTDLAWAIRLGWECGLSISDACLLKWDNFYPGEMVLRLRRQKTNEACIIPLDPHGAVLEKLRLWHGLPRPEEWPNKPPLVYHVLPSLAASYIVTWKAGDSRMQLRFKKVRALALPGCDKTFHNLRASFCSRLANGGMNLAAACRITGHKDPQIFLQYITPNVEQLREQMMKAKG